MAAFGSGEPHDPHVRTALEVMRVISSGVLLALIAFIVVTKGGIDYALLCAGVLGAVLGLPVLAQLLRKG